MRPYFREMDVASVSQIAVGVMVANLFTIMFLYSAFQWSRRERNGTEDEPGSGYYLLGMVVPLAFLCLGAYAFT